MTSMLQKLEQGQAELAPRRAETEADLLRFAVTDVLLFWSNQEQLQKLQAELWQPVLDWVADKCGVPPKVTTGLDVPEQDPRLVQVFVLVLRRLIRPLGWRKFGRQKDGVLTRWLKPSVKIIAAI